MGIFHKEKAYRLLSLGFGDSGKTSILYFLEYKGTLQTIPTIGSIVHTIERRNKSFTVWEIGGQDKIRKLWRLYYPNTDGILFVVDTSDKNSIEDAAEELRMMAAEKELQNAVFLIYANKQDLKESLPQKEVIELMELEKIKGITWHVQCCSAVTGEGIEEGFDWLVSTIIEKEQKKKK